MGRLPRPDHLTRREREVLVLVRTGLTNEEIAERLGISLDGAKYHVSQILSKLGVSSREEAAELTFAEARPWWTRALVWGFAAKAVAAALAVAVLAGTGLLAWGVLVSGGARTEELAGSTGPGPHIGDHWHATYVILIGDEPQPNIATFKAEMDTNGDGIIHIHPSTAAGEGRNATLRRFFEYAGGKLTSTELRVPGQYHTYREGDPVPGDGRAGGIRILAEGEAILPHEVPPDYVPQDGQRIRIMFAPENEPPATPVPSGWQTYRDPAGRFQFSYPPAGGGPTEEPPVGATRIHLPVTAGTNLVEKYVDITVDPAPTNGCPAPVEGAAHGPPAVINGIPFETTRREGVALGSFYEDQAYSSIARDGACVGLTFVLHSSNRANYPSPPPQFDSDAESAVFGQIMSTFVWSP